MSKITLIVLVKYIVIAFVQSLRGVLEHPEHPLDTPLSWGSLRLAGSVEKWVIFGDNALGRGTPEERLLRCLLMSTKLDPFQYSSGENSLTESGGIVGKDCLHLHNQTRLVT